MLLHLLLYSGAGNGHFLSDLFFSLVLWPACLVGAVLLVRRLAGDDTNKVLGWISLALAGFWLIYQLAGIGS